MSITITDINCVGICVTGGSAFVDVVGSTVTRNYCVSNDSTADDAGGVGHLVNQNYLALFVSATGGNLQPKDNGPLVNAGLTLDGFTKDIFGNARPIGKWTIGAIQFIPTDVFKSPNIGNACQLNGSIRVNSGGRFFNDSTIKIITSTDINEEGVARKLTDKFDDYGYYGEL